MPRIGGCGVWASVRGRPFSPLFPDAPRHGRLIVVSGPSGVGKTSVVEGLSDRLEFRFSVSMTTRARRPGEEDGVDYLFVTEDAFRDAVAGGDLVEWAEYGGNLYGTPRSPLEAALSDEADLLLDIEMLGARQIKEAFPSALLIFIAPPSMEELERRLRSRGDTSEDDIARRLAVASEQIAEAAELFDHLVVNDELSAAIDRVADILAISPQPRDSS